MKPDWDYLTWPSLHLLHLLGLQRMLRKWEQIQHNISSPYLEENYNFLRHEQNDENFCVDYYDDETRKGKCF